MKVYFLLNYFFYIATRDHQAIINEILMADQEQECTQQIENEDKNNNQMVQYDQTQNLSEKNNNTIYQTLIFTGSTSSLSKFEEFTITVMGILIIYTAINLIEYYNSKSIQKDINNQIQDDIIKQQQIDDEDTDIEDEINQKFKINYHLNQERLFNVKRILHHIFINTNIHQNHVPYVQNVQNTQQMFKVYGIKNSVSKKTLQSICSKFRLVKGDGNSLYTAFGYQYLTLLLLEYDDQSFQQVLMKYKNLRFRITTHLGYKIEDNDTEKLLREEFYYRLQQLRQIEDINKRKEAFFIQFSVNDDNDQFLHSLSTIFLRNLAYSLLDYTQGDSILEWEKECDNDEYLLKLLSEELKITSQVVLFDGEFITTIYYNELFNQQQYLPLFILLLKQGHYSIGIQ